MKKKKIGHKVSGILNPLLISLRGWAPVLWLALWSCPPPTGKKAGAELGVEEWGGDRRAKAIRPAGVFTGDRQQREIQ